MKHRESTSLSSTLHTLPGSPGLALTPACTRERLPLSSREPAALRVDLGFIANGQSNRRAEPFFADEMIRDMGVLLVWREVETSVGGGFRVVIIIACGLGLLLLPVAWSSRIIECRLRLAT
jgi:hypothetical protein